jgi:hypothetical protein
MKRGPVQPSAPPPAWKVAFFKRKRALEFAEAEAAAWDAEAGAEGGAAGSAGAGGSAAGAAGAEGGAAGVANPPNDMTAQFVMDFIRMDGGMVPGEMVKLRDMLSEELGLTGVWAG